MRRPILPAVLAGAVVLFVGCNDPAPVPEPAAEAVADDGAGAVEDVETLRRRARLREDVSNVSSTTCGIRVRGRPGPVALTEDVSNVSSTTCGSDLFEPWYHAANARIAAAAPAERMAVYAELAADPRVKYPDVTDAEEVRYAVAADAARLAAASGASDAPVRAALRAARTGPGYTPGPNCFQYLKDHGDAADLAWLRVVRLCLADDPEGHDAADEADEAIARMAERLGAAPGR